MTDVSPDLTYIMFHFAIYIKILLVCASFALVGLTVRCIADVIYMEE